MLIIGIHFGHDSSFSVVKDGEILLSVEEERFTRIKTYGGFPYGGINYASSKYGIKLNDADFIVISGLNILNEFSYQSLVNKFSKNSTSVISKIKKKIFSKDKSIEEKEKFFYKAFEQFGVDKSKIVFRDHHLLHAASAYFQSPFEDCLIVTSDGRGDSKSSTVYTYENNCFIEHSKIDALSSVGQMYTAVTMYLGFKPSRHEGKITGLAAYGEPSKLSKYFLDLIEFDESRGMYSSIFAKEVNSNSIEDIFDGLDHNILKLENVKLLPNDESRKYESIFALYIKYFKKNFMNESKEDIAAAVQYALEKIVTKYIEYWAKKLNKKYVCLAGGVFANVKLNQRVLEIDKIENIFVQPAMGDSGLSLGGALLLYSESIHKNVRNPIYSVYKGPKYSNQEIESKLKLSKLNFEYYEDQNEQAKQIAKLINQKHLVGIFNGRMEFGPRALGARTVMISPVDKTINDTANKRFNRTEFMPFAPVIMDKYAKDYFKGYKEDHIAAEFMTITYDVYEDKINEIQAVVHVDGTARPQVIKKEKNPLYYMILEEFYNLTGIPTTVNTSFNAHEEPILESIDNAINALNNNIVDYLCIENFIVSK